MTTASIRMLKTTHTENETDLTHSHNETQLHVDSRADIVQEDPQCGRDWPHFNFFLDIALVLLLFDERRIASLCRSMVNKD